MLYPELFKQLESVRWDMDKDIPWADFEGDKLSDVVVLAQAQNQGIRLPA